MNEWNSIIGMEKIEEDNANLKIAKPEYSIVC